MNRVIKFRAWDGKKMLDFSTISMDAYMVCFFHDCMLKGKKVFKNAGKTIEVTVMQFTGLLDAKGREIYEGDVAFLDGNNRVVVWHEAAWFIGSIREDGSYMTGSRLCDVEDVEVIGNIYENPDLPHLRKKR